MKWRLKIERGVWVARVTDGPVLYLGRDLLAAIRVVERLM